jgi:quinoprotein relay system zinc metallohydrolase 2
MPFLPRRLGRTIHPAVVWAVALCLGWAHVAAAQEAGSIAPLPVQEVAAGVFVFQAPVALADPANGGAIANIGFIIGREAVAVIDTGGSLAEGRRLLAAIRARTGLPVRYVVNTHVHPDHVLGNGAFVGEGAAIVGHRNLPEALAAREAGYLAANGALIGPAFAGTKGVAPTLLVADRLELDIGGRRLLLEAWPTSHTNSDLTLFDEATGSWFLGDLLFVDHVPALDGSLRGWRDVLGRIAARAVARAIPGHGPIAAPWPASAGPMQRYLGNLDHDIGRLVREGRPIQDSALAALEEAPRWALFDAFHARNAMAAFHEREWE